MDSRVLYICRNHIIRRLHERLADFAQRTKVNNLKLVRFTQQMPQSYSFYTLLILAQTPSYYSFPPRRWNFKRSTHTTAMPCTTHDKTRAHAFRSTCLGQSLHAAAFGIRHSAHTRRCCLHNKTHTPGNCVIHTLTTNALRSTRITRTKKAANRPARN